MAIQGLTPARVSKHGYHTLTIIPTLTGKVVESSSTPRPFKRIHQYQQTHNPPPGTLWGLPGTGPVQDAVISYIEAPIEEIEEDQLTHSPSKVLKYLWDNAAKLRKMTKSTEIAIAANQGKQEITLSELVPDYAQKFTKVFEKRAAERFPPSRPWDHKIEFNLEKNPQSKKWGKIYPLTLTEKEELRKFVDENLAKGFI